MGRAHLKPSDIHLAKAQDLISSQAALRRAALAAREQAVQTNTAVVILREQKIVRLDANALRAQPT